nr:unnamed protein product [Digitaria exilis]
MPRPHSRVVSGAGPFVPAPDRVVVVDSTAALRPLALIDLSGTAAEAQAQFPEHDDLPLLVDDQTSRRHAGDKTLAVHAGEKLGARGGAVTTDSIVTPVVSGTTHWFKSSEDLIAYKEGRRQSFEYGRYGNPTVKALEDKISALERAEVTMVTSSGMNAIAATLLTLLPPGSHVVATTDCYSEARAFIHDRLGKMGIKSTFIDLDDMEALKAVLEKNEVTLFYADSPTNPLLKCVDIRFVAELCHRNGALVCIDSTMASPINQKPLTLGADIVLHSATKYMAGHHDVIAGCVSGSEALISRIRPWHHDLGGAISPVNTCAYASIGRISS